jgi:uncharacterized protein YjbI with pentapeptide repeats
VANENHVEKLKRDVLDWNAWRLDCERNSKGNGIPDLSGADLSLEVLHSADLSRANLQDSILNYTNLRYADLSFACLTRARLDDAILSNANLRGAIFASASLRRADLHDAFLPNAELSSSCLQGATLAKAELASAILANADLRGADRSQADLGNAKLMGADLSGANLTEASFAGADLTNACLRRCKMKSTNLERACLSRVDLRGAELIGSRLGGSDCQSIILGGTVLAGLDLSNLKDLTTWQHGGPSSIDFDTITSGPLPPEFLRGIGLAETFIEYLPSLLTRAIHYYSCFISYSVKDQEFANRVHADLQNNGVRCWFAPHDLAIGVKILDEVYSAIRLRDKVLLILSENALNSEWVEDEVTKAFEEERNRKSIVLFPVRLDDAVMTTNEPWAAKLRARHIGDFRNWKVYDSYMTSLERVLRDLLVRRDE